MNKDLNILHRRRNARVLKPVANKYSYKRQKVFQFKLSTGYIILRYSRSRFLGVLTYLKYGKARYNKFRKWCRRNHMPRCRAITHAGLCYESRGEINVSERLKRGAMTHHLDRAYPVNRRNRLIVLKPKPALTFEQSVLLSKVAQKYSSISIGRNPFQYVGVIINLAMKKEVIKYTPLELAMSGKYQVDHSIHWEKPLPSGNRGIVLRLF